MSVSTAVRLLRGEIPGRKNFLQSFRCTGLQGAKQHRNWLFFSYHDFHITCALTGITEELKVMGKQSPDFHKRKTKISNESQ